MQPMKNGMRQPQAATSLGGKHLVEHVAEHGGDHDRHLLAAGLPGHVEALVARRRHFRQIDRDAAEFDAGREALQQASGQHQHGREQADGRIARHEGDQDRCRSP